MSKFQKRLGGDRARAFNRRRTGKEAVQSVVVTEAGKKAPAREAG
jgi:hypothetical protein